MAAKADFDTSYYVDSHRKLPRGRGSWAFCLREHLHVSADSPDIFWANGTYADAKKLAKGHFLKDRQPTEVVRIYVLS